EILERAELRFDVLMPAAVAADAPISDRVRHAGFARLAFDRVVAAFAICHADRMYRRKIDHVETHRLRVFDARNTIAKSRTFVTAAFRRAWEKFIPGSKLRAFAIDIHARVRLVFRRE